MSFSSLFAISSARYGNDQSSLGKHNLKPCQIATFLIINFPFVSQILFNFLTFVNLSKKYHANSSKSISQTKGFVQSFLCIVTLAPAIDQSSFLITSQLQPFKSHVAFALSI